MSLREWLYDSLRRNTSPGMRRRLKEQAWFMPIADFLFSNDVYSESYYEDVERLERDSLQYISSWIKENINPRTVIDVGCGPGHMMEAFHMKGMEVRGVDISISALRRVKQRGLQAEKFDLTAEESVLPGGPYDLAISCEVAEHLKEKYASMFVQKLCQASDVIFLTAAEPDAGMGPGMMHFNEQPNSYWIALFDYKGFELDSEMTESARKYFNTNHVISYLAKPMIFRRRYASRVRSRQFQQTETIG